MDPIFVIIPHNSLIILLLLGKTIKIHYNRIRPVPCELIANFIFAVPLRLSQDQNMVKYHDRLNFLKKSYFYSSIKACIYKYLFLKLCQMVWRFDDKSSEIIKNYKTVVLRKKSGKI